MKQRKRRLPADKVREAVLGRTWYERTNTPETFTCTRCNEERNSVGQEGGICLRCRWGREEGDGDVRPPDSRKSMQRKRRWEAPRGLLPRGDVLVQLPPPRATPHRKDFPGVRQGAAGGGIPARPGGRGAGG